jgi:hypothetical protein
MHDAYFLSWLKLLPTNRCKRASHAPTPSTISSNAVLSPRLFHKLKSRRWLRKRLATGFELSRGGPAKEIEPSGAGEKKF